MSTHDVSEMMNKVWHGSDGTVYLDTLYDYTLTTSR